MTRVDYLLQQAVYLLGGTTLLKEAIDAAAKAMLQGLDIESAFLEPVRRLSEYKQWHLTSEEKDRLSEILCEHYLKDVIYLAYGWED